MNVWIVNPFDNLPVEGYRPQRYWLMSEAFARAGHAVTFWTQDWSHAKKKRRAIFNTQPSTVVARSWKIVEGVLQQYGMAQREGCLLYAQKKDSL